MQFEITLNAKYSIYIKICLNPNIEINLRLKNLNDLLTNLTAVNNHLDKDKRTVLYDTFDFY